MANLCFDCEHAVPDSRGHGCSWSRDFIPVEGWVAEKDRKSPNGTSRGFDSYAVTSCPLFDRTPERSLKKTWTRPQLAVMDAATGAR